MIKESILRERLVELADVLKTNPDGQDPRPRGSYVSETPTAKEKDKKDLQTQDEINRYLSDTNQYDKILSAYRAILTSYDGEDNVDILPQTVELLIFHQSTVVRREIANAFIDSFPHQQDELGQALARQNVLIEGLKKIEIPEPKEKP